VKPEEIVFQKAWLKIMGNVEFESDINLYEIIICLIKTENLLIVLNHYFYEKEITGSPDDRYLSGNMNNNRYVAYDLRK